MNVTVLGGPDDGAVYSFPEGSFPPAQLLKPLPLPMAKVIAEDSEPVMPEHETYVLTKMSKVGEDWVETWYVYITDDLLKKLRAL